MAATPKCACLSTKIPSGLNSEINFLKFLGKYRKFIIFSHMTEVQSGIIAPISKLLGIRHLLWYAHKSKSKYLVWNNIFVDEILTSTSGSCPIKSHKIKPIGQGIDQNLFPHKNINDFSLYNALTL